MTVTTGLSGNEIYCLMEKGYTPGNLVVGNSVHSLGFVRSVGSGLKAMLGGEMSQITELIEDGRKTAYDRMMQEAAKGHAHGVTGVDSRLIVHGSNVEFLAVGSIINGREPCSQQPFTTSADGQELYAQMDVGFKPICFAFGNVAYSIGVTRGMLGAFKTLGRGEIKEYSDVFNETRHLALERIIQHAKANQANAVLGIKTTILPFGGVNEMLMLGTASTHPMLQDTHDIISSDMTNVEMWNMAKKGYVPQRLLLGTSIYSLGFVGGVTSTIKSFVRGEINELTRLIYDARENAIGLIHDEANAIGADDVVGVKTYIYQLNNGLIEFLAIGTAVKKREGLLEAEKQLPPQAIVVDRDTFYDSAIPNEMSVNLNAGSKPIGFNIVWIILLIIFFIVIHIIAPGASSSS